MLWKLWSFWKVQDWVKLLLAVVGLGHGGAFLATVLLFGNFHVSADLLPLYYTAGVVHSSAVVNWRGSGRRGENYQNKFTLVARRRAVKVIEAGQGHSQVEWTEIGERFRSPAKWVSGKISAKGGMGFCERPWKIGNAVVLVRWPTRWSLYWYLDFCADHLYFTTQTTEILHSLNQCW